MSVEHIRKSIERAINYLGGHPDEARYTDTAATASWERGLRFRAEGPGGALVVSDMPKAVGGEGSAPSPGWLMRAALATCDATLIAMRAAQEGVELTTLEVTVDSESDDRGLLGMDDKVHAGPLNMRTRIQIGGEGVSEESSVRSQGGLRFIRLSPTLSVGLSHRRRKLKSPQRKGAPADSWSAQQFHWMSIQGGVYRVFH